MDWPYQFVYRRQYMGNRQTNNRTARIYQPLIYIRLFHYKFLTFDYSFKHCISKIFKFKYEYAIFLLDHNIAGQELAFGYLAIPNFISYPVPSRCIHMFHRGVPKVRKYSISKNNETQKYFGNLTAQVYY